MVHNSSEVLYTLSWGKKQLYLLFFVGGNYGWLLQKEAFTVLENKCTEFGYWNLLLPYPLVMDVPSWSINGFLHELCSCSSFGIWEFDAEQQNPRMDLYKLF